MSLRVIVVLVSSLVACAMTSGAARAEPFGVSDYVPPQPREDRADLADLAPPSGLSTATATYGDAAFAHRSRTRMYRRAQATLTHETRRWACRGPTTDTNFKGCAGPVSAFFQHNYVFTPSHVSAPQVVEQAAGAPTPLLSPITGFFLDPVP